MLRLELGQKPSETIATQTLQFLKGELVLRASAGVKVGAAWQK